MRECEGEELERQLRGAGVIRGLNQAREMGMANAIAAKCERAGKVLKAPVVGPPDMASPLGADDAQGASPLPCVEREGRGWHHGQAMGRAAIDKFTGDAERPEPQAPSAQR